jgi:pimeloyl-ACP methyl ester carboxylesterase
VFELVTLVDGRVLSYVEQGVKDGFPVLFFEGSPGMVRLRDSEARIATERGIRVLAVHRPGYRASTPRPGRTVIDWAYDVEAFADALALDRFAVLGHSAGSSFAMACGAALAGRVTTVGIGSGHAPLTKATLGEMAGSSGQMFRIAAKAPWAVAPLMRYVAYRARKDPAAFLRDANAHCTPSETAFYDDGGFDLTLEAITEQADCRAEGMVEDVKAIARPWGFEPSAIPVPVTLWYGNDDVSGSTPPSSGHALADTIPNSEAHFFDGESHEGFFTHFEDVINTAIAT